MNIKSRIIALIIVIFIIVGLVFYHKYNEQNEEQIISMVEVEAEQNIQEIALPTKPPMTENEVAEPTESTEIITTDEPKEVLNSVEPTLETTEEAIVEATSEPIEEATIENENSNSDLNLTSLGEFLLTAYCSCEICCDEYALNRPVDENGNEIVYGAIGVELIAGVSIAVDPKVIPYRSEVVIDGKTYIAHDTGGAIKGNRIDVYHNNHEEALNFAMRNAEVFIVGS